MAFEKRDATQLVSCSPPLPVRAFRLTAAGSTTEAARWGGSGTDGRRYGYFGVNVAGWEGLTGLQAVPPMSPGETFLVCEGFQGSQQVPFPEYGSLILYSGTDGSPDLIDIAVYEAGAGAHSGITLAPEPAGDRSQSLRCVGVQQVSSTVWNIYYYPYVLSLDSTTNFLAAFGIVTVPMPMSPRWLGTTGHVQSLVMDWSIPGGPTQATFTLAAPPDYRTDALNPGRILQGFRGGSCIWEGILTEPVPSATGWQVTANGAGTYGASFAAVYDGPNHWASDNAMWKAAGRGLHWQHDGFGKPATIYYGTQQDSGSLTITDWLNLLCTEGSLYWSVEPPAGNAVPAPPHVIRLRPLPPNINANPLTSDFSAPQQYDIDDWQRTDLKGKLLRLPPDLYIVNTTPVARTIHDGYNTLILKYLVSPDTTGTSTTIATAAQYSYTVVDNPGLVAGNGRVEYYVDLTVDNNVLTEKQATAIGKRILQRYVNLNWTQAFQVMPGQLLNNGGAPVDLGCGHAGKIASVQVMSDAFGGDAALSPATFTIGTYSYDDDTQTATVTPYQAPATDIASVIAELYPGSTFT